jgi:3D (Asp-Asp-Asp) domain-containing protein
MRVRIATPSPLGTGEKMLNRTTKRISALLVAITSFVISYAQSDDGTLLSPNMPLPSPLNLLPISIKPQPAPTPISAQPQPAPVVANPNPIVVATPTPVVVATPTSSVPVSTPRPEPVAAEPISKPAELPSGLVMPISINPKPTILSNPPAPRVSLPVTPKPAAKPVTAKPTPKPAPKPVTAKPAPKPIAAKPAPKPVTARPAPRPTPVARASSSRSLLVITVKSTAYNSIPNQTDSTPFVTATGSRTRFGIVALSRDLLRRIPYGSIVRIEDLGNWSNGRGRGTYNRMLSGVNFIVEDTMHIRKRNTVDVWMPTRRGAIQWGARQIRVTVIRLGRR